MEKEVIEFFKFHRKMFCEDYLKKIPKDSIGYQATLKEIEFYNKAIKALERESSEDAVSRQAVFETIDDCNSDGLKGIFCSYDDGERFKEYIKKLPPITPTHIETVTEFADRCVECGNTYGRKLKQLREQSGWIPVSEKSPEDSGEYLVSVIDEEDEDYKQVGVAWFAHPKDYDIQDGEWRDLMIDEKVIAWRPLPEPYKAEMESEVCKTCYYNDGEVHAECVTCDKVKKENKND